MSRSKPPGQARRPQLPFTMRQELGIPERKRNYFQTSERRQMRKEERRENGTRPSKRQKTEHASRVADRIDNPASQHSRVRNMNSQKPDDDRNAQAHKQFSDGSKSLSRKSTKQPSPSPSLSLSENETELYSEDDDDDSLSRGSREYSPEVVLDAGSRTFLDRQAEDDAEILALERKLGGKGKNTKIFDDGYDELLESLEGSTDPRKIGRETNDWLKQKRSKAAAAATKEIVEVSEIDNSGEEDEFWGFDDGDEQLIGPVSTDDDDLDEEDDDGSDGTDDEETILTAPTPVKPPRENPYVAPTTTSSSAKYVPPSRRQAPVGDTEQVLKLRKQAQGSLNKLSEANIISIVDEFSKLYQTYPRQEVTDTVIDLLIIAFTIPTTLNNTFIILHAAFITALYKICGADFGAEVISKLVETFDKFYQSLGKESLNLTSLLANLFTFNMISSGLIYDHIRLLLSHFGSSASDSEDSAEQLLRIIRDCGPQLRSDDPTALKGIVAMMNEIAAKVTADGTKINIRTRVMMDTITDLKNNKIRHNTNSAGVTGEHLTRMRKALGSLSSRQLRGTEPLGLSRADILNSDKKGKWWLVGASWKGHNPSQASKSHLDKPNSTDTTITMTPEGNNNDPLDTSSTIDIRSLATTHNLTTPLRLSIFTAIITAHSPPDALHRLTKLRLTRRQEPEVPRVLLTLCRAEPNFNPYYAALSRQLLRDRKYKMPFNIALWKFFAEIGESPDQDHDDQDEDDQNTTGEDIRVSELANIARLYARLVAKMCIQLDILKTLNIGILGEKASMWLEVFFISLLAQNKLDDEALVKIFGSCEGRLRKSIAWFLRKNVRGSDLLVDREERRKVKKGFKLVEATFAAVEGEGEDVE